MPIILLTVATRGFDATEMREYINHLEEQLGASNPSGLQTVRRHIEATRENVGDEWCELQDAMRSVLPAEGDSAQGLVWNPHGGGRARP